MSTHPRQPLDPAPSGDIAGAWLGWFFRFLLLLLAAGCLAGVPFSVAWLYQSGDMALERAVEAQAALRREPEPAPAPAPAVAEPVIGGEKSARAGGESLPAPDSSARDMSAPRRPAQGPLPLFGPGQELSGADILSYKLALCRAVRPSVVVMGGDAALSLRAAVFTRPMVNLAGTARGLADLARALDGLMGAQRPDVVIIALDFRWFGGRASGRPSARSAPRAGEGFSLSPALLRLPWRTLAAGRCSFGQFLAPLYLGFRDDRFGARAQFASEGFGPDGSWYPTALVTGRAPADRGFAGALGHEALRVGPFAHDAIDPASVDAFADIYFRVRARGAMPVAYIPPLAGPLYGQMRERQGFYPQLFALATMLESRGIPVLDAGDASLVGATDCEFLDAATPGEVASARVLRALVNLQPRLLAYVNMERIGRVVNEWAGHAQVRDTRIGDDFEVDFLGLGCLKKTR